VRNTSATPGKLYKKPNQASAKSHKAQLQRPNACNVQVTLQMGCNLMWLHRWPQLESQRAATKSTYHANSSSTSCSILSIVYYSKRSRGNSCCGCCYSLMFGMVMMLVGGSLRESGHCVHGYGTSTPPYTPTDQDDQESGVGQPSKQGVWKSSRMRLSCQSWAAPLSLTGYSKAAASTLIDLLTTTQTTVYKP
jgi:hypothetical protein